MNPISRRGFLGVIGAFTAAAATRAMPTSLNKSPPAPEQIDLVARLLKECRATSVETHCLTGDVMRCVVTYRHDPDGPRTALDEMAAEAIADRRPIAASVTVTQDSCDIDVTMLGRREFVPVGRPQATVTVDYV